jgi:hydrogenase expression/formation protein HypD
MKYLDEYRDGALAQRLVDDIRRVASRPWSIMEVCGGQTHSLLRHGIDSALDGIVELIHGPGCPVCVTPVEAIDFAHNLAFRDGVQVASFGDMLRVPGSRRSLLDVRAAGGRVKAVYSPLDAVELARRDSSMHTVFFAVGFETTAPATALAVLQAADLKLNNFSLLVAHVRVQPAMETLMDAQDCHVQGFLAAGHVCTVVGFESYEAFVEKYRVPLVVTGFEPLDLLTGIRACVCQLEEGRSTVENCYPRSARLHGNTIARDIVQQVYEPCDQPWRGFGVLPAGGLRLQPQWSRYDAARRFGAPTLTVVAHSECRSGDVLSGRIKPLQCPAFGSRCIPEHPLGAPMVSSEGTCAAYYRYREIASSPA